jgi:hypothetical protein
MSKTQFTFNEIPKKHLHSPGPLLAASQSIGRDHWRHVVFAGFVVLRDIFPGPPFCRIGLAASAISISLWSLSTGAEYGPPLLKRVLVIP